MRTLFSRAWRAVFEPPSLIHPSIRTVTGRIFDFNEPRFEVDDIAHALSNICRFAGHVQVFYSVAQHSVLASYLVPREHAFAALMHDAHEAYLGDVSAPLKQLLPDYQRIEKQIEGALRRHFDLPEVNDSCVRAADLAMLAAEKRDLMHPTVAAEHWPILNRTTLWHEALIRPQAPADAEGSFRCRFTELHADWRQRRAVYEGEE